MYQIAEMDIILMEIYALHVKIPAFNVKVLQILALIAIVIQLINFCIIQHAKLPVLLFIMMIKVKFLMFALLVLHLV